jgi:hypothetical protein
MGWLVTYLIHSTILLGLAWGLDRLLRGRPHWQEPVWKMALIGGLLTATVQTGAGLRPWGGTVHVGAEPSTAMATTGFAGATSPAREMALPAVAVAVRVHAPAGMAMNDCNGIRPTDQEMFVWPAAPAGPAGFALAGLVPADPAQPRPLAGSAPPAFPRWRGLVLGLWAAGALILLGALARSWLLLQRRLQGRRPLHGSEIDKTLSRLASGSPQVHLPRLSASNQVAVPIAMGIMHPEICVPERVLYELSHEAQESLLAHELGHIVRRDPLWRLVCSVIGRALYFQPLNWVVARKLDACAELLSDDWAAERTAQPLSLAECLTAVARWATRPMHTLPAAVAITGASDLRQRIERLIRGESTACKARLSRWAWPAAWFVLTALTLLAPAACGVAEASSKRAAAPDQAERTPPRAMLAMAEPAGDEDADSDDDDESSCQQGRERNHGKAKGEHAKRKHDRADRHGRNHDREHRYSYAYKYEHGDVDDDDDDDDDDDKDVNDDDKDVDDDDKDVDDDNDNNGPAPRGHSGKQARPAPSLNLDLDLHPDFDVQLEDLEETLDKAIPSPQDMEALLDKALVNAGKGLGNNQQAHEKIKKAIRKARKEIRKELAEARKQMKSSLGKGMDEAQKARIKELRERIPEIQRRAHEAAEQAGEQAREQAREHAREQAREHARKHADHAREQAQQRREEAQQRRQDAREREREAREREREAREREREAQQRERAAEIREKVREKMKNKAKAHKQGQDDGDEDDDIYDD